MTPILLVTQEDWLRNFVKKHTDDLDIKILKNCETSKQALDIYTDEKPPIIIIDMFLTGASGLELLKSLRRVQDNQLIMIIARMRNHSFLEKAFRYGANDVVEFPPNGRNFHDIIEHRLQMIKDRSQVFFG